MDKKKNFNTDTNFHELKVPTDIADLLAEIDIKHPSPIQEMTLPHTLQGQDVVGKAETGTGKTFCFGIPMVHGIDAERTSVQGLILTPTRELAHQIADNLRLITPARDIQVGLAIGGEHVKTQVKNNMGSQIMVATPGRVLDLVSSGNMNLGWVQTFVLDEFDRMLEMGFIEDVQEIFKMLPEEKHTMLFSATAPKEVKKISAKFMRDPIWLETASGTKTSQNIEQKAERTKRPTKFSTLRKFLDSLTLDDQTCLIFCNTKKDVRFLDRELWGRGYLAASLSSDHDQDVRLAVLDSFRRKEYKIIIATDVASRGLDIDHIEYVVNYNVPLSPEEYVHRIGRTGRADRTGKVLTYVTQDEYRLFSKIVHHVGAEKIENAQDILAYFKEKGPAKDSKSEGNNRRRRPSKNKDSRRDKAQAQGNLNNNEAKSSDTNPQEGAPPKKKKRRRRRRKPNPSPSEDS